MVEEAVHEALGTPIQAAEAAAAETLQQVVPAGLPEAATRQRPPLAGAKQSPSGAWYVRELANQRGWTPVS